MAEMSGGHEQDEARIEPAGEARIRLAVEREPFWANESQAKTA